MELIFDILMLADHGDEGGGRPHQTGNIDAVVTGDRRVLVRHPNRFYGNDRLETRPFRQVRQGCQVCDGPHSAAYHAAVRVIKGIKEILGVPPGQMVFDLLLKVGFDGRVGLFIVALQGEEIIAALVSHLGRDRRLTVHGINGHDTPFEGK